MMALFDVIFFKFIGVGAINTIVGSALMFGRYNFAGMSYWASSAINYCVTSMLSFFLNKYVTFAAKDWSAYMVIAFVLTIAVSYLAAYGVAKPLAYWLLRGHSRKICDNGSLLVGMCLFTALNYLGQRFVAFSVKK
jgi:putative flippase GtrA